MGSNKNFKISNQQKLLIFILGIIGAIIGYYQAPLIYCIRAPCNQIYQTRYTIYGFVISGLLTYLIEIIYNYFRR